MKEGPKVAHGASYKVSISALLVAVAMSGCGGAVNRPPKTAVPDGRSGDVVQSTGGDSSVSGRTQSLVDNGVVIDRVELEAPGYAVLYANGEGAPGVQVGVSELLDTGIHHDVVVDVEPGYDSSSVFVVAHLEDNNNESMDFPSGDAPAQGDAGVVLVELAVNR